MNGAYYNEHDPFAAAWLRGLIGAGLIAPGIVDERDIRDVQPDDIRGYAQCHFFAGIGGWSYALRLAEWDDARPVWSGSCPCQPFSSAGKGGGFEDPRHLWPAWFRLIRECRPAVVFGEQVASADGLAWFDTVSTDMEAEAYAVGAADLCAAGVGAPHIRQRLFFVADNQGVRFGQGRPDDTRSPEGAGTRGVGGGSADFCGELADAGRSSDERRRGRGRAHGAAGEDQGDGHQRQRGGVDVGDSGAACAVGDPASARPARGQATGADIPRASAGPRSAESERGGSAVGLADSHGERRAIGPQPHIGALESRQRTPRRDDTLRCGAWDDVVWLPCSDGKLRSAPTEPALQPLAYGLPGRVGVLRGAGNAIVPQAAAEMIAAYMDLGR